MTTDPTPCTASPAEPCERPEPTSVSSLAAQRTATRAQKPTSEGKRGATEALSERIAAVDDSPSRRWSASLMSTVNST